MEKLVPEEPGILLLNQATDPPLLFQQTDPRTFHYVQAPQDLPR
jgi:hypothetical protein